MTLDLGLPGSRTERQFYILTSSAWGAGYSCPHPPLGCWVRSPGTLLYMPPPGCWSQLPQPPCPQVLVTVVVAAGYTPLGGCSSSHFPGQRVKPFLDLSAHALSHTLCSHSPQDLPGLGRAGGGWCPQRAARASPVRPC